MSASTSRSNSTTSTAPSTPRLSPRVQSSEWKHSTMTASTSHPVAHSSQEWWEHVLPPGQLAERLRKAQRSSSASRRRNNPALANATPSERSAWKRLSGLPNDRTDTSASSSKRTSLDEPSSWHVRSSTDVSSDDNASPTGRRSPARHAGPSHFASSSRQHSPEQASIAWPSTSPFQSPPLSRSTSTRRCRISSEDGSFTSTRTLSHTTLQRSFSGTNIKRFPQFEPHSLPDTPEISSDEKSDARSSTTVTANKREKPMTTPSLSRRPTPPTILRSSFDHPEQPSFNISNEQDPLESTHAEKHVSFDESGTRNSSHITFNFPAFSGHDHGVPVTSLPRSNSTRRVRQGVRINGRKATSFSLPGSRRSSLHDDLQYVTPRPDSFTPQPRPAHKRSASMSDAALLDSLNVAHKQLASAGNLALTLTRQLSAPLRPFFHMTLFFSISSITVASLACFLLVSYMLTAWDDVSQRSQKVSRVAIQTKTKVECGLGWGIRMLGSSDAGKGSTFNTASSDSKARTGSTTDAKTKKVPAPAASDVVFWPMRMALTGAGSIASRVTPAPIADMFSSPKESASSKPYPSTRPAQRQSGSALPPRPPLSLLLPSIMFTLVIAIGAGLTSFFASRRAAAGAARTSPAHSRPTSPGAAYAFPKSGSTFVHVPASFSASTSPLSSPVIGPSHLPRSAGTRDRYLRPQPAF